MIDRVNKKRVSQGMSLRQFANELDVSPSIISLVLNGHRQPSIALNRKLIIELPDSDRTTGDDLLSAGGMVLGGVVGVTLFWLYERAIHILQAWIFSENSEVHGWYRFAISIFISLGVLWIALQPIGGSYKPYFSVLLGIGTAGLFTVCANAVFYWLAQRFSHRSDSLVATVAVITFFGFVYGTYRSMTQ